MGLFKKSDAEPSAGIPCPHGVSSPWDCGSCKSDYDRMYRLDHKTGLSKAEGKELDRLERKFSGR